MALRLPIWFDPRGVRTALLAAALLLAGPCAASAATAAPAASGTLSHSEAQDAASLEPQKLALDQIESTLQRDGLDDSTLGQLRTSLEPLRGELREAVEVHERRLADVDARLKQIGDPPAAGAPPEDAALAAERARLGQRRSALDGSLKQARLLSLRADDLVARITDLRRSLFTQRLVGRSSSALNPSFWMQAGRAAPDGLRGMLFLGESWWNYALANGGLAGMAGAVLTLVVLGGIAVMALRWLRRLQFPPLTSGTRFAKSCQALATLLRSSLVAPAAVVVALFVLDGFGLVPPRIMEMALGLVMAVAMASFGRGVALGLFAPGESERRLLAARDETADLVSRHLIWAARILGIAFFINVVQRAVVSPVSLTVATSALFSAVIAALLVSFLFKSRPRDGTEEDEVNRAQWLRGAGWLLVAGIAIALATGFIAFASFLAGRFLTALGVIGALYILLVFVDALFTEILTAHSPRGRAVAAFFGLKPRSIELLGTLLSALIRVLLVLVVLLPLLGPWGLFAADFFGVVRDAALGLRIGGVTISLTAILTAFVILLVGVLLTRGVQSWLDTRFLPRTTMEPGLQNSVSTIFGYVGVITALLLALAQFGLDFQKITIVAGALSIGIGFGLQSVVSNFVSGLILLAERPIRVGDIINVKGEEGRVQRIHVRATEIVTGDTASVIIPNSELITGVVKNWTHANTFSRITVKVGVAYDSDVEKVRDILLDIARSHPRLMPSPSPSAVITGLGENAIMFELGGVVRNIGDGGGVKSDLYFSILSRFRAEGIRIPYPQREIAVREGGEPEPKAPKAAESKDAARKPAGPKRPA
jgi:small-conductance mechanosensitive channel